MINMVLQVVLYGCAIISAVIFFREWRALDMFTLSLGGGWGKLFGGCIDAMGVIICFRAALDIGLNPPMPGSNEQLKVFLLTTVLLMFIIRSLRATMARTSGNK